MTQELVLIPKEEYELLLLKQKRTPDYIINQDEVASVNQSVNNKQNSTLMESNKEDLRQDQEAPVNQSLNNVQKLNESKKEENAKLVKAVQESKSALKGAGKKYVRQSIEQFFNTCRIKIPEKEFQVKGKEIQDKEKFDPAEMDSLLNMQHFWTVEFYVFTLINSHGGDDVLIKILI